MCWKKDSPNEMEAISQLGETWNVSEDQLCLIEKFVCCLYNSRKHSMNNARFELFMKKFVHENKIINISTLPPCQSSLFLHIRRAKYIAKIWKSC